VEGKYDQSKESGLERCGRFVLEGFGSYKGELGEKAGRRKKGGKDRVGETHKS